MSQEISEDDLLEDLKRVADELGESPTQKQYNKHGQYSHTTFVDKFGSWNNVKQQLDLSTTTPGGSKATVDEIVDELKQGKTLDEIKEKYGYNHIQSISRKIREGGYTTRSKLTKNRAGYGVDRFSGNVSLPASMLDELGVGDPDDTYYYEREVFQEDGEKGVKLTFHESRVKEVEDGGDE